MTAARKLVEPDYRSSGYEDIQRVQSKRPKSKKRRRRIPATIKICLLATFCVVVASLYLQQQLTSYHLNLEVAKLHEQVNSLEQRNDHLMLKLESQRSLAKIEQLARTNLGMVDPQHRANLVVDQPTALASVDQGRWIDDPDAQDNQGVFDTLAFWLNKAFPIGGVEAGTLRR